jgi:hypothetical protein
MSYGHRLNLEDIFFELAELNFKTASQIAGTVPDGSQDGGKNCSFRGYPTDEGLALVSISVVGWATSLEAFTNLAWNNTVAPQIPQGKIRETVIKQFSTPEKVKEILLHKRVDLGQLNWWSNMQELFALRNELVHYRHEVVYQGHSFAPVISRKLSEKKVLAVRQATISAISEIGKQCGLRIDFLDGNYLTATVNE